MYCLLETDDNQETNGNEIINKSEKNNEVILQEAIEIPLESTKTLDKE